MRHALNLSLILVGLISCQRSTEDYFLKTNEGSSPRNKLHIINPIDNTLYPPEIYAPNFSWDDTTTTYKKWYVYLSDADGKALISTEIPGKEWKPDRDAWENIKKEHIGKELYFTVLGVKKGLFNPGISFTRISLSLSKDSVGAPVFYRAVPLPFSYAVKNVHEIEWYLAYLDKDKPQLMLNNIPVCANCHSFPSNGKSLAMDVDYANDKGSYAISEITDSCSIDKEDIISWSEYRRDDGESTFGLLSQISPDGQYTLSTVKDRSVFVAIDDNFKYSQLFFPVKGIIGCYDKEKDIFYALNGANDKDYVQSNPSWSPDGKEIIFARGARYTNDKISQSKDVLLTPSDAEEFINGNKDFKFDLYRMPFNEGRGGIPVPIPGASENGKSNYFAKYSPDGKWIVFCQANSFMLLQEDSKMYIMPTEGGEPRLMNCNTADMNSWHSWSPNSKWIVFSSKIRGAYTKLCLTHIDDEGNDSPPIILDELGFDEMAVNIPEFYTGKYDHFSKIVDNFSLSPLYFVSKANDNVRYGEYFNAFENLQKAIDSDPTYFDAYLVRIRLNKQLGQLKHKKYLHDAEDALKIIDEKIVRDPKNELLLLNRANLFISYSRFEEALKDARKVIRINPKNYEAYEIAGLCFNFTGHWEDAIDNYRNLVALNPDNDKEIRSNLISALTNAGRKKEALQAMGALIEKYPSNGVLYLNQAFLQVEIGKTDEGILDLEKAVELDPGNPMIFIKRAELFNALKRNSDAQHEYRKALIVLNKQINEKPDDIVMLFERASLKQKMNDAQGALEDYNAVLNLLPENFRALTNVAQIELGQKNWYKVLEVYATLNKYYEPESHFFINPAIVHIHLKQYDKALTLFNEGLNREPENTEMLFNRGILYVKLKEKDKARDDFESVRRLLNAKKKHETLTHKESELFKRTEMTLKNLT